MSEGSGLHGRPTQNAEVLPSQRSWYSHFDIICLSIAIPLTWFFSSAPSPFILSSFIPAFGCLLQQLKKTGYYLVKNVKSLGNTYMCLDYNIFDQLWHPSVDGQWVTDSVATEHKCEIAMFPIVCHGYQFVRGPQIVEQIQLHAKNGKWYFEL